MTLWVVDILETAAERTLKIPGGLSEASSRIPWAMKEPHQPPSRKEVEDSGTADWVEKAIDRHQQRQQKLQGVFSEADRNLRDEKERLANVWKLPAENDPEERGPDLFAAERDRVARQQQQLSSIWDEDRAAREAEQDQLRNLFGPPPGPNPKKRR